MRYSIPRAPSLVLVLIVGSRAFAPPPTQPVPCSTGFNPLMVGSHGACRSFKPVRAKPQPREGEREGDFESDDPGMHRAASRIVPQNTSVGAD